VIHLGRLSLCYPEDVSAARQKVLGLARSLNFDVVPATRIAFAVSEQSRLLVQNGRRAELDVSLGQGDGNASLVLQFRDSEAIARAPGLAGVFDSAQAAASKSLGGFTLTCRVGVPPSGYGFDERLLQGERARLAEKTRTQLLEELQAKNRELERYNSQLEAIVAERTAELRGAYDKIKKDLETAADYVRRLIPGPCDRPVAVRWQYVPSADLGGDIFGYHAIGPDHFAVYLLDVTGHGVDSALLAVSVVNVIRSASLPGVDFRRPGQVLQGLNDAFPMEKFGDKMFTIWYGVIDHSAGTLRWAGGGHPDALLYAPRSATPIRLPSEGPMVGMIPGLEFPDRVVAVPPAARLFVYSDGAHEIHTPGGETWEFEAFIEYVSQISHAENPLQDLLNHVRGLRGFDQLDDDFSALVVNF
jgi:serine phosphatase RsbU (regulator of sigma subunit)